MNIFDLHHYDMFAYATRNAVAIQQWFPIFFILRSPSIFQISHEFFLLLPVRSGFKSVVSLSEGICINFLLVYTIFK